MEELSVIIGEAMMGFSLGFFGALGYKMIESYNTVRNAYAPKLPWSYTRNVNKAQRIHAQATLDSHIGNENSERILH